MDVVAGIDARLAHVAEAFDVVAVPVLTVGLDLTVVAVNRAFRDRFGPAADLLPGLPVRGMLTDDDVASHDALAAVAPDRDRPTELLREIVGPAGRRFAVRMSIDRIRVDGRDAGYAVTMLEVDDLPDGRSAAALVSRRWRNLLDELPLAVVLTQNRALRYANPAALELLGCADQAEAEARIRDRAHVRADERDRLEARIADIAAGRGITDALRTWHIVRPDGTERTVQTRTLPVTFDGERAGLVCFVDVTEHTRLVEALRRSEARLESLLSQSPVGIFETDAEGRCVYVNDRWIELTGTRRPDAHGWGWVAALHEADRHRLLAEATEALVATAPVATELRLRRPDGEVVHAHVAANPLVGEEGRVAGWLGTVTDLTAQIALREELAESEARFRDLADNSPDVVLRLRLDPLGVEYVSPSIALLTGSPPEAYVADPRLVHAQLHPDDLPRVLATVFGHTSGDRLEFRVLHLDGTFHVVEARLRPRRVEGRVAGLDATLRDVTAAANLREHLRDLARRDPLTGLLNRRALVDALHERAARRAPTALLFIDLDDFKSVNDTLGHDAGDDVLTAIAGRLTGALRSGALVSRFAGDEFVVVLEPEGAHDVAARLRALATHPIVLRGGSSATVGMSIGVAVLDHGAMEPVEDLLHRADDEMYRAKRMRGPAR